MVSIERTRIANQSTSLRGFILFSWVEKKDWDDCRHSVLDPAAQVGNSRGDRQIERFGVAASLVFHDALGQAFLADHYAMRDADQVHVGEHYARALVAVVEQYVEPGGGQVGVQRLHRLAHR